MKLRQFFCSLCAAALLISALPVASAAAEIDTLSSKISINSVDNKEIATIVETYLNECAQSIYLSKDFDFERNTLIGISASLDSRKAVNSLIAEQEFFSFRKLYSPELEKTICYSPTSPDTLMDNLILQSDRTKYFRHLQESRGFSYNYFNTNYVFDEIIVDKNYAIATVIEKLDYQYCGCDFSSYEQYTYNISLAKVDGQWVIVDVVSDDPFFLEYHTGGFDLDAAIEDINAATVLEKASIPAEPVQVSTISPQAQELARAIRYNKQNAVNYAFTYTTKSDDGTKGQKPEYTNPNMPWLNANCMNFVSQCIWAGLGGSNSAEDINNHNMMDTEGTSTAHKWYTTTSSCTSSWSSCSSFKTYVDTPDSSGTDLICQTKEIDSTSNDLYFSADSLIGAAIQTKGLNSNNQPVQFGHVVFVTEAYSSNRDWVFITAYNGNWKNVALSSRYGATSQKSKVDNLYIIVPSYMRAYKSGLRLWADLLNAQPVGTSVPINGYANTTCNSFKVKIYNPSGKLETTKYFTRTSSISSNYTCSQAGTWKFVLSATDSSDTASFTYIVRVY